MPTHKEFTVATNVKVYFCDPQIPWQRGTNENTNLLLRQYLPRGTDLALISQAQLDQVALPHANTTGYAYPVSAAVGRRGPNSNRTLSAFRQL